MFSNKINNSNIPLKERFKNTTKKMKKGVRNRINKKIKNYKENDISSKIKKKLQNCENKYIKKLKLLDFDNKLAKFLVNTFEIFKMRKIFC